ncbi:hypothetical protein Ade02nite_15620 [Paractinoplanes deccanensis]|uniref:Uncharacterized protein n=1 Tax=Paractinoplanes deccanensis TaxID=113561 RepID=A0ABQ3XYU5_9ACTN|nr:hypothetical protein Ade02nite_15620 [Actinoplanes deccanensis]
MARSASPEKASVRPSSWSRWRSGDGLAGPAGWAWQAAATQRRSKTRVSYWQTAVSSRSVNSADAPASKATRASGSAAAAQVMSTLTHRPEKPAATAWRVAAAYTSYR